MSDVSCVFCFYRFCTKHAQIMRIHIILCMRKVSTTQAFALHWYIPWYPKILAVDSEGPDQTARTHVVPHFMRNVKRPFYPFSLRKHSYSNILKVLPPQKEKFPIKISDICHISSQNIDCGYSLEPARRGGSNEYPQSMFWAEIRKILYTLVNPVLLYKSGV